MSTDDRLAELERRIRYLTDRQEILDCITRNSRGNDRFDTELTGSSFHRDGFPVLGPNQSPSSKFGEQSSQGYAAGCEASLHNVTTHACEIDGDTAHTESYVIGLFLEKGGEWARVVAGRYVDRLDKRDGHWRIALRRATMEVHLAGTARLPNEARLPGSFYLKGSRDKHDPSYQRPLTPANGARW